MNQDEKRQLENQLLTMGLPGLNSPELFQAMADLISNFPGNIFEKHNFLRDLLNECDADKRYEMYTALAPRLRFKALPLEQYEMRIAERAGAMVSKRYARVEGNSPRPINIGNQQDEVKPKCRFRCWCCGRKQEFKGETLVDAVVKARKLGWERTVGFDIETCARCVKLGKKPDARKAMEIAARA